MKKAFVDTNVILSSNFKFSDYKKIFISIVSIEELDNLKNSESKGYLARQAIRNIINADNVEIVTDKHYHIANKFLEHKNDNIILSQAFKVWEENKDDFLFLSDDYALIIKAKTLGLPYKMFEFEKKDLEIYKGFKEVVLSDEELAEFYQNPTNKWGLLNNEYFILKNSDGDVIDKQKWKDDIGFSPISYRQIENIYMGKIKPKNIQQELAFDLFQNKNIAIKCIFGKHGSGKDLIMSVHALNLIQRGVYDRLVFVRNNYGVKNSKDIGYLPGSMDEKLLPFAMPLADHVGGIDGLKMLINQGKIELQHLGFIRGRDIKNSIVYVSEAENMTKEHIQLLIGRLAECSTLWLNGDFKQVDDIIFEKNSGLKQVINCLKGNDLFGCVELNITERSKTAQLAELLD